jgi:hypothetical protein
MSGRMLHLGFWSSTFTHEEDEADHVSCFTKHPGRYFGISLFRVPIVALPLLIVR